MTTAKGVRTHHPEYDKMLPKWQRAEAAAEGQDAIYAGAEKYLPRLAAEKDADYKARMLRTPFFNATYRTVAGLKGMLFRKPPQVTVPAAIKPYLDDVDMRGTPLEIFTQEVSEDDLTAGRIGILVDFPQAPNNESLTVKQAEKLGRRPMMQIYGTQSIINWRRERINGAMVLTLAVLKEEAETGDGDEFSHKCEDRYRVLDLVSGAYRQRVFRINEKSGEDEQVGDDFYPLMQGSPIPYIPFEIFGVDDFGPDCDPPPLIDLIDMNIHHYQVSADYEHGCHFSGLPTLFISGYRESNDPANPSPAIYIGGPTANTLSDPASKAYFVEVQSNFAALKANLDDKKAQMAVLGARMLEQQKADTEAADTIRQRSAGEQSQLAGMAMVISLGIEKALRWMAAWAGDEAGEVLFRINTDFIPTKLSAQELTAILSAWQAGMPGFSDQNVFWQLKAGEMIEPETTLEEEQARVAEKAPRLVAPTE